MKIGTKADNDVFLYFREHKTGNAKNVMNNFNITTHNNKAYTEALQRYNKNKLLKKVSGSRDRYVRTKNFDNYVNMPKELFEDVWSLREVTTIEDFAKEALNRALNYVTHLKKPAVRQWLLETLLTFFIKGKRNDELLQEVDEAINNIRPPP